MDGEHLSPALRARVLGLKVLASKQSNLKSCLLYINGSDRMVGIYWMDYNGYQVHYRSLRPGVGLEVDTYITHPWIFRDMVTGERMHVRHNDVYYPELYRIRDANHPNRWITCRRQVIIHLPLISLRSRCLWNLAVLLNERRIRPNVIHDLPQVLRLDLKKIQVIMAKHKQHLKKSFLNR